jgi:hypothetical protein
MIAELLSKFFLTYFKSKDLSNNVSDEFFNAMYAPNIEKLEEIIKTQHIDLNLTINGYLTTTFLCVAAYYGYENVTKLFLQYGANPNIAGGFYQTPLHLASTKEVAELLIEHGANLTLTNDPGMTPYRYQAALGCKQPIHAEIAHVIEEAMQLQGIAYTPYECS